MPTKKIDKRDLAFKGALGRVLEQSGMKKSDLAERMNIGRTTLYNWRENPGLMSLESFRIMTRELRFSDEEILKSIR
jgi:predicted transcriptional regulator